MIKLKTLVESKTALEGLLKGSLPISIAWELKKFLKVANDELITFEELRTAKIIEMGEPYIDENGQKQHKVKPELFPEYIKVINELAEKEVDVIVPQIKIKDLINYKDVNGKEIEIKVNDLIVLDWLIKDE
jgi:hypothetical protein